jgi:hypothetical protein
MTAAADRCGGELEAAALGASVGNNPAIPKPPEEGPQVKTRTPPVSEIERDDYFQQFVIHILLQLFFDRINRIIFLPVNDCIQGFFER